MYHLSASGWKHAMLLVLTVTLILAIGAIPPVWSAPVPGSVVHTLVEHFEAHRLETISPYNNVPMSAITPNPGTTERWVLVGANGSAQAAYSVARDEHGTSTQISFGDVTGGQMTSWWPAINRIRSDPYSPTTPVFSSSKDELEWLLKSGFKYTRETTLAGLFGGIYSRSATNPDGRGWGHHVTLSTGPTNAILDERRTELDIKGNETVVLSRRTVRWELLPPGSGPAELGGWSPPGDARSMFSLP